jgi:GMP reductase
MRFNQGTYLDFSDVLLIPKRSTISSRKDIDITRTFKFKYADFTWTGVPIISSNMTSVTTLEVVKKMDEHQMLACLPKTMMNIDLLDCTNWIPSTGLQFSYSTPAPWLCIDVPNAYIEDVVDLTKKIREGYTGVLIVGNVVTAEQTEALILAGADIVKVGIGSGAACSTRIKTGVGMPQLSAVIECSDAAHGLEGHIISDGGCCTPADIVKAFAGGADFVMLGGMLSGCTENGREFYGSSSKRGNNETAGGLKDYRAAEGWEMAVPDKGPIDNVLQDIEGGLRSACSYCGAKNLKNLPKCATFIRVTGQVNTSLWNYRI